MEELIKNVILKYTMIKVENSEQNLLDLPVVEECWIYVIMELENTYNCKRLNFMYDRKNPRLLSSSRSTLTIHI